jgi:hypothetical protein
MLRRVIKIGVAACVVALVVGGLSIAAQQAGGQAGGRQRGQGQGGPGGPGGGRGNFDPAQMRQMMAERMKEQLNVDDQAWKVMEPRLMKVVDLSRQASGGGRGMMGMFGGRGNRSGPGGPGGDGGPQGARQGGPQGEQTAVDKAITTLQTTLENQSASTDDIKKQLTAVREAREKAKQELAAAQADLKQILTLRQEAQLVLMGMLN